MGCRIIFNLEAWQPMAWQPMESDPSPPVSALWQSSVMGFRVKSTRDHGILTAAGCMAADENL